DFFTSECQIGHLRIVSLDQIPVLRMEVASAQIQAVLRRNLLLGFNEKAPLFGIVVLALPPVGMVKGFDIVTEVAKNSVLNGVLGPSASAQVFGARIESKAIALEKSGIFLLGNSWRQSARADRSQQVCQQEFVFGGGFIPQIDQIWVAELEVAVREKQVR